MVNNIEGATKWLHVGGITDAGARRLVLAADITYVYGHAQKVLDPSKATGAIIGKALGALEKGKGRIPVLVTLQ